MALTQNKNIMAALLFTGVLVSTFAVMNTATAASWTLSPAESRLNFISIKKTNVIEVHQFKTFAGNVNVDGKFTLEVDLSSVDTKNEVRDGRMKEFLFEIASFATATLTGQLDMSELDAIAEGANTEITVDAQLDLHGHSQTVALDLVVTRLVGAKMSVVSLQPVILKVDDFGLVAGVEKLKELAKLPSISQSVPVSFFLTFKFTP